MIPRWMNWDSTARRLAGVSLALVLLAGCDRRQADYSGLELVDVRGTVTLDGQPLADAMVVFEAVDRTYSSCRTDASGGFRLMFNSEQVGVSPGVKTVRIRTSSSNDEDESAAGEGQTGGGGEAQETIPACYNTRSQLQVTVGGSSQTVKIDLLSDGSTRLGP